MRGPYGFEMTESCKNCKLRASGFFCQMSAKPLADLDSVRSGSAYPQGAVLFMENQEPRGVFVLCEGEIKLTMTSKEGKTLILRIARPGEILGATAVMSGKPYEVTAETMRPCQIAYVRRDDFLRFVAQHTEAMQSVLKQLSAIYQGACEQLRTVGLSASASEKVAKLLLEWTVGSDNKAKIRLPLTHEEIAECIGSSRETVTRTLSEFKRHRLIERKGATLLIANRRALEEFAGV
jgi:CRP/FNR family transcriptional regulator, cyclic AMP receptor protein